MRLLYISVHSSLQYDEVGLFQHLGFDVDVAGIDGEPWTWEPDRPPLGSSVSWDEASLSRYQIIGVVHDIEALARIWRARRKNQRVIWRTIGQCSSHHEYFVRKNCPGVEIVRYSPRERRIEGFAGESALIRFYKDSDEFCGWTGGDNSVMVVRNRFLKRGFADDVLLSSALEDLPWKLYGVENDGHPKAVGAAPYASLIEAMRRTDVFFASHSVPASYTLNFIEALMTGAPVVAFGRNAVGARSGDEDLNALARRTYELDKIIVHGQTGFLVGSAEEAKAILKELLNNSRLRAEIGSAGRATAMKLFDKRKIEPQWRRFLGGRPSVDWRRAVGLWGLYALDFV
jgi:hypothetical protein